MASHINHLLAKNKKLCSHRQAAREKYLDQSVKCLELMTKSDIHGVPRSIYSLIMERKWQGFVAAKKTAILRGHLQIVKTSVKPGLNHLTGEWEQGECEKWLWVNSPGKNIEITDKRLLKILEKGNDLPLWTRGSSKRLGREGVVDVRYFTNGSTEEYHNNEFKNFKVKKTGRFFTSITSKDIKSRENLLKEKWGESVTGFDMKTAHLNLLCHMWLNDPMSPEYLKKDCEKLLSTPNVRKEIARLGGLDSTESKIQVSALINQWRGRAVLDKTLPEIQLGLVALFPLVLDKIYQSHQDALRNPRTPRLGQVALDRETLFWRGSRGVENLFLSRCKELGVEPKMMDLHDGVLVSESQKDIMWECVTQVCQDFQYPQELIVEKV